MAQAVGRKARAVTTLGDVPQGTVPFRVRPNGPLMLRIELLPAGALRVQGPRTRVSRVLPNEPGVSWLKEMALLAITPSSLLRLRLDNRVEADSGGGGGNRARTGEGEPIARTGPRRRSGSPWTSAVQGGLKRALTLLRPGARPVNSVDGMGYHGRLPALQWKGDWGGGDAKRSGQ